MKSHVLLIVSLALLTGCEPGQNLTENDRTTMKQEVLQAHQQLVRAAENLDAEGMFASILDNEGVILQNGVFRQSRQAALNATKDGFAGLASLTYKFDRQDIEVLSHDAVLLKAAGTSIAQTQDGREFQTPFVETVIFTKTPDGWKIRHAHQSTPPR